MQITLPEAQYPFAVKVPRDGASCRTCKYLSDSKLCTNEYYLQWNNGSGELGAKPRRWCCSAWSNKD